MILGRLIMRFLLVPLGAGLAIVTAVLFVVAAHWNRFAAAVEADPSGESFLGIALVGAFSLALLASAMLLPAILGALIAEAFAIRSWMFHVANGGVSAWVGTSTFTGSRTEFYADPWSSSLPGSRRASPTGWWRAGAPGSGSRCSSGRPRTRRCP